MKLFFKILFVFLLFLNIPPLYSEETDGEDIVNDESVYNSEAEKELQLDFSGKMSYSFLIGYNVGFGLDVLLNYRYPWQWEGPYLFHIIGIEQQVTGNGPILRLNYSYHLSFFIPGIGASFSYNFNNNDFGIAPQTGIHIYFLSCFYRYNIVIKNTDKNFHEIILSIHIPLPL
jgi:hypothetical protein